MSKRQFVILLVLVGAGTAYSVSRGDEPMVKMEDSPEIIAAFTQNTEALGDIARALREQHLHMHRYDPNTDGDCRESLSN